MVTFKEASANVWNQRQDLIIEHIQDRLFYCGGFTKVSNKDEVGDVTRIKHSVLGEGVGSLGFTSSDGIRDPHQLGVQLESGLIALGISSEPEEPAHHQVLRFNERIEAKGDALGTDESLPGGGAVVGTQVDVLLDQSLLIGDLTLLSRCCLIDLAHPQRESHLVVPRLEGVESMVAHTGQPHHLGGHGDYILDILDISRAREALDIGRLTRLTGGQVLEEALKLSVLVHGHLLVVGGDVLGSELLEEPVELPGVLLVQEVGDIGDATVGQVGLKEGVAPVEGLGDLGQKGLTDAGRADVHVLVELANTRCQQDLETTGNDTGIVPAARADQLIHRVVVGEVDSGSEADVLEGEVVESCSRSKDKIRAPR